MDAVPMIARCMALSEPGTEYMIVVPPDHADAAWLGTKLAERPIPEEAMGIGCESVAKDVGDA